MAVLNPYINFPGNTREAMTTYQSIFGGQLDFNTFADFGQGGADGPPADGIMHSKLETTLGFTLMAADGGPEHAAPAGSMITVSINGEEADEIRGYFEKLSDGAEISMPLAKQVWGDEFGQLTDKFGVQWMVNIIAPQPAS